MTGEIKKQDFKTVIDDNSIRQIFFGGIDISKFSRDDVDLLLREIKSVVQIWENNKHKLERYK